MSLPNLHVFRVPFYPHPDERAFLERAEKQSDDELDVVVAVLDDRESERFFGVPLARRGMQPVWLSITNRGHQPYRLRLASLDPNYYPPLEAAYVCHFKLLHRLLGYGLLAWAMLPLILLLPVKLVTAWIANRRITAYFQEHGLGSGVLLAESQLSGFVFATHDAGTKQVAIKLYGGSRVKDFEFSVPIPGMKADYGRRDLEALAAAPDAIECDEAELARRLEALPACTTNHPQTRLGDPLNLAVVGDFATILQGFGAGWDETEVISLGSCWRTLRSFVIGTRYRYSPISALYCEGRSQDVALQKIRHSINERLHLRLWMTPLRLQGKPVWIGQVSRDIGVRFTWRTWNLTTHRIDPNVDEARDYVVDNLMEGGHVSRVAFVGGVGACRRTAPRHNLTGDPYYTGGHRAVIEFSETRTEPVFLNWT